MDPITGAALIGAGSNLLGRAMGPASPAGPAISGSGSFSLASGGALDFSGWTVSTGGNQGTSNAVGAPHPASYSQTPASGMSPDAMAMGGGMSMQTIALYALIAVVAIRLSGK